MFSFLSKLFRRISKIVVGKSEDGVPSSDRDIANAGKQIQALLFNPQTRSQGKATIDDLAGQAAGDGNGPQDVAQRKMAWLRSAAQSLMQNGDPNGRVLQAALSHAHGRGRQNSRGVGQRAADFHKNMYNHGSHVVQGRRPPPPVF